MVVNQKRPGTLWEVSDLGLSFFHTDGLCSQSLIEGRTLVWPTGFEGPVLKSHFFQSGWRKFLLSLREELASPPS